MSELQIPYGLNDLERSVSVRAGDRVKCVVKGCGQWLKAPTRQWPVGEACSQHGLIVHRSGTYRYANARDNVLVRREQFAEKLLKSPYKYDRARLAHECSEDALVWNTFVSMMDAGKLHRVVQLVTGQRCAEEPQLFLWGLKINKTTVEPWDLLVAARERFESDLPVCRPQTEPDVGLLIHGHLLILLEAKFTSGNTIYQSDATNKLFDMTIGQLVTIYRDNSLKMMDDGAARQRRSLNEQLWRNAVLAEWMARQDSARTEAYVCNLVREGYEDQVCEAFLTLMRPESRGNFEQLTWETVHQTVATDRRQMPALCRYLEQKTARLKPAFRLTRCNDSVAMGDSGFEN